MPILDNLILGRPGGERRRRNTQDSSLTVGLPGSANIEDRYTPGKETLAAPGLHRRSEDERPDPTVVAQQVGERRVCGSPLCNSHWTPPWKSRAHPVFEGHWACSQRCLEAMVRTVLVRETGDVLDDDGELRHRHRIPLGLVMLAQGWITHPQLQKALEAQRSNGSGRIGDWLVSECGVKPERVVKGVSMQWNCPVLSTEGFWPETMALTLPRLFLEEYGIVPLRLAGKKTLYVGFHDYMDAAASFALEQMTGLKTENGVLAETEFHQAREVLLRCDFPRQTVASVGDRDGLARAIAGTVEHEQPEASRLVKLHKYYWLRTWARVETDRLAGDLPASPDGVSDYLFKMGSPPAISVSNDRSGRVDEVGIEAREAAGRLEEQPVGSATSLGIERLAPSAVELSGSKANVVAREPAGAQLEKQDLRYLAKVEERIGGLSPVENDATKLTFARVHRGQKPEPIDGEYLANDEQLVSSTPTDEALATADEPERPRLGWGPIGLWQKLRLSYQLRGSDRALGQGQEE